MIFKRLAQALALLAAMPHGSLHATPVFDDAVPAWAKSRPLKLDPAKFRPVAILPMAVRNKGCTFYEHRNGGGEAWRKTVSWLAYSNSSTDTYAQTVATVGPWWNDRISSIRCDDSASVRCSAEVWRDVNRGGGDAILWGSQGMINLDKYGWNDIVSSYMVFCDRLK